MKGISVLVIVCAQASCAQPVDPDLRKQIDFDADGVTHQAMVYGGGTRAHLSFEVDPDGVVLAGLGLTQLGFDIDISMLEDTTDPTTVEIQQMTVCDPRVSMTFSLGGDHYVVDPGSKDIDACGFHSGTAAGTVHGVLAFQYMKTTGTSLLAETRFAFITANRPEPGVDHMLQYAPDFTFP